MPGLREYFNSPQGRPVGIGLAVVVLGVAVWFIWGSLGSSPAQTSSTDRVFICSETGKTFRHKLKVGDMTPVLSPHSGKNTGYEPELCYWTKDGKVKEEPTYVLLNQAVGKQGPSFCQDCGRLVVGQNPIAAPGLTPPPTREQMNTRRGG